MNVVFSLVLFIHAIIHVIGFSKAFELREFDAISKTISREQGIAWACCTILFVAAASGNMLNKRWWPYAALFAVVISQVLLIINWSNAGWGTILNILIAVVALIYAADFRFQHKARMDAKELLAEESIRLNGKMTFDSIGHLPAAVQIWLAHAGVIGQHPAKMARLKQKGKMKTDRAGTWMPFEATQYITATEPGYIWNVKVRWQPMIFLTGRDELDNGKGSMQMKLLSIWNMANVSNNAEVNTGSLVRWLAEICWSPAMALSPAIKWQAVDSTTAQAIVTAEDVKVSGIFHFNQKGDITSFSARRYKSGKDHSSLETWQVDMISYKSFHGIRIPNRCKVTWKLANGDFTWMELEVTDIDYNNPALYN